MFRVIVIFLSDDMAKIVLKSCETCNASTLLPTPAGDVRPAINIELIVKPINMINNLNTIYCNNRNGYFAH